VSKQTGKGSHHQRRASAIERKATKHRDFVGDADAERAEAEFRKRDRQREEENREVVREMAGELEAAAGTARPDGAFRLPRSVEEAKEMARTLPDRLREKARERLESLPEPAQTALRVAESAAILLLVPVRVGLWLAREAVLLPLSLLRTIGHREA
jgi:hypothetical protein